VSDQCNYIADWISINDRWGLTMDPAEWVKLHAMLAGQCKRWLNPPAPPP
jgi:hypothetical protein